MSVLRQLNLLGQQRIDVPHLRALESSIAADFDVFAGRIVTGSKPLVVRGFTLSNYTAGTPAVSVQLNTADGILMNIGASEAGTFLWVPADRSAETLDPASNSRVSGGFTANQTNYIGLDLIRAADSTTSDLVQFLDASTLIEQPKTVPLARTLDYRIVISTVPFSAQPNIVPIAKIKTNASNQVASLSTDVEDARNLAFRLGAGGDFPNRSYAFGWSDGRVEFNTVTGATVNQFRGGDKIIVSQKDWMDAVMTRIWEIGGGENWYSPVADRNVRLARNPSPDVFSATTGDNFEFVSGHLHWRGLSILFENSNGTGVFKNQIADQTFDQVGLTDITPGQCIYVDVDRTQTTTLTVQKANLWQVGTPVIPGSRIVVAWCLSTGVIMARDTPLPVNTALTPATVVSIGGVRLSRAASTPPTPTVISDTGGTIAATTGNTGLTISSINATGLSVSTSTAGTAIVGTASGSGEGGSFFGAGSGSGVAGTGGASSAFGVSGTGGATNGSGVDGTGTGTGAGARFTGGGGSPLSVENQGLVARGGTGMVPNNFTNRVYGAGAHTVGGSAGAHGLVGRGGSGSTVGSISANLLNVGVYGVGSGSGEGVVGISSATNGSSGVYGQGSNGVNARGVVGQGSGTSAGVEGIGGSTSGHGVVGTGGGSGGSGGYFSGFLTHGSQSFGSGSSGHGAFGKGSSSGSTGVFGEGGDFNGFISPNDATSFPGANAGGAFTGSYTFGGIGVGGYGRGYPGGATAYGGYFVGATDNSGGSPGIFSKGGQGSGANASGTGVQGYGGFAPGTANGGLGGFFWGGISTGGTGGTGVVGLGGTPNGAGGSFTATGNGHGVTASSPGASGIGVRSTGFHGLWSVPSTSGYGLVIRPASVVALTTGVLIDNFNAGTGINITGTGSSQGISVSTATGHGVVTTSSGGGNALQVGTGNARWTGANPATNTAFTNTVTPKNIVKAWCLCHTDGAGGMVIDDGFNISGIVIDSGGRFTITFAQAFSSGNFSIVVLGSNIGGEVIACTNKTASTARIDIAAEGKNTGDPIVWRTPLSGGYLLTTANRFYNVIVCGAQ